MHNISIQKASQSPESVKSAVERMLGRPIAPEEEISIVAVPPQQIPPAEDRAQVARQLEALLSRRGEKLKDVPDDAIDIAIDEAVDDVRHRRS